MNGNIRAAVIPAGGLGTRFLPATRVIAKEMLPVVDKPLIHYAVEEVLEAGIERIILVTGPGKSALVDYCESVPQAGRELPPGSLVAVRQPEPLGLGHAVWCARKAVGDGPFAVLLPDDLILGARPCLTQMAKAYGGAGGVLMAAMPVAQDQVERYGIIAPADDGEGTLVPVAGLVEKPATHAAPSRLAVIGRYVLPPGIFAPLSAQRPGTGGEIQLTDAIAALIGKVPVHGFRFAGERFDCGDKLGLLEAGLACALARPDLADATRGVLARAAARAGADRQ